MGQRDDDETHKELNKGDYVATLPSNVMYFRKIRQLNHTCKTPSPGPLFLTKVQKH